MSELIETSLYALHLKLAAKMVPFAGYKMPLQYSTGIIQEHRHCREQAGFFDISHMGQCLITGQSVAEELEKLTPSNISGLKIGQQRYTVLTNDQGGVIDDIIITRTESGFLVIVNAACKEKDFSHFKNHLSEHCDCKVLQDQALFALQGPKAAQIMGQLSEQASTLSFMQACNTQLAGINCFVSRCGYTGEDGFEISIANSSAQVLAERLLNFTEVAPIGLGARDTLRLEAGLSLYGHEITETISPVEAGLKWIFRKNATDFLGAKAIQGQLQSGVPRRRVGLVVDGKVPLRADCELVDNQNNRIGLVTSGSFSPSLKKPIALALIDSQYKEKTVIAKVRNHVINASITQLPFIPHRYYRS